MGDISRRRMSLCRFRLKAIIAHAAMTGATFEIMIDPSRSFDFWGSAGGAYIPEKEPRK